MILVKPSSRIIVRNLPKHTTAERFKRHFENHNPAITDTKLVFRDGVFRRFAFVGYKTEQEAVDAVKYFNNTYFDTSKIAVEPAVSMGGELGRPWSKHSKGSSAHDKKLKKQAEKEEKIKIDKIEQINKPVGISVNEPADEKLNEFLQVMLPRSQAKTWSNDDTLAKTNSDKQPSATPSISLSSSTNSDIIQEDDGEYQDLPNLATKESPEEETTNIAKNKDISDMDYFKSKIVIDDQEPLSETKPVIATPNFQQQQKELEDKQQSIIDQRQQLQQQEEQEPQDLITDTGRLLVQNISYSTTLKEVEELFSRFGPLSEVHIPIDKFSKKSKGYAFVLYLLPEHAVKAFVELDGTIFQGRILNILPAKEKPRSALDAENDESSGKPLSFKDKRARDQKKNAMKSECSWNSLFMNSNAVAAAIAEKLNVEKSAILDPSSDNMAVRLALAETQIINETKEYLEAEGIYLDAFNKQTTKQTRSNTTILVKDIPHTTTLEEITQLFSRFGEMGRVILPPTRTVALVEFLEVNEAKAAFRHLAYTKFHSLPLYLEWAPMNTFTSSYDKEKTKKAGSTNEEIKKDSKELLETPEQEMDDADSMPVATLFVKNLNFSTTEEKLKDTFMPLGGVQSVRIATKPDKSDTTKKLSMGYGFVEFKSKPDALKAFKSMQGYNLEGHSLKLSFSNSVKKVDNGKSSTSKWDNSNGDADGKNKGTKLIVRNIPFEATKSDVQQLFRSFGQVKAVRIATKVDGSHRGFGFVDFLTKQEAKSAFKSLAATHLYGRHLVIEWANEDDNSVEAARQKTKRSFIPQGEGADANKRRKVVLGQDLLDEEYNN